MPGSGSSSQSRPSRPHLGASPRRRWPPWRQSRPRSGDKSTDKSTDKSAWDWRGSLANFLFTGLIAAIVTGLVLAYFQHQSDQNLSRDQQQATILQTYMNNMQALLLHYNLATSAPGAEVRQEARVQTITTLGSLDPGRNKIVFQFLQDAHLIGTQDSVINLSNADLSKDNLSGADLSGVDMSDATLTGADLDGTQLRGAILTGALINDASMNGTTMTDALLNGADLTGADLTGAELIGANLTSTDLTDTDLSGTNLNDADLLGSYYARYSTQPQQQLDAVYSCTNAILSPGLICPHDVKITLTYWYTESPKEQPVINNLISQFESEKQYRNININAMPQPFSITQRAIRT